MDCKRLENQVKAWYFQVQDEALAPARMVDFMEKHIATCEVCVADEVVRQEVKRITEIVLPPAKVRKKPSPATEEAHSANPNEQAAVDSANDDEVVDNGDPEEEEDLEDPEDNKVHP